MKFISRLPVLCLFFVAAIAQASSGWGQYRVQVRNEREASILAETSLRLMGEAVQLGTTDMIVGPTQMIELLQTGLKFEFVQEIPAPDAWVNQQQPEDPDYRFNYLNHDQILAVYESIRLANPTIVKRQQIAITVNNNPVWVYTVQNATRGTIKLPPKAVLSMSLIHAREWITGNIGMYCFETFVNKVKTNRKMAAANGACSLYFVPILNPDGYKYTWTNDRYWRKNRLNGYGVDLNRNFAKGWGLSSGSSGNTGSDTYRGPSAFSERETAGLRDFINSVATRQQVRGFMDFHSYGPYILWPWAYTTSTNPDAARLATLGQAMDSAITAVAGRNYVDGPTSSTLYLASGASTDWAYDSRNADSYTIESRGGTGGGVNGFVLPESEILVSCQEAYAGLEKLFLNSAGF